MSAARKYARGRRRPGRASKPVNISRHGGGGHNGCLSMLAVLATGLLATYGLTWLAVDAGLALSHGLAYVLAVGP